MNQPCILILAGGQGTRLRSLNLGVPKPLAPVVGRPFLEHRILKLRKFGFQKYVIAISRHNRPIQVALGSGAALHVNIRYYEERVPQGTGGAIRRALPLLPKQFYAMNGDTFIDFNPMTLDERPVTQDVQATIALIRKPQVGRYGSVRLSDQGLVESFQEKSSNGPGFVYAGVARLHRAAFRTLPMKKPLSFEHDVLPRLVEQQLLAGIRVRGSFWDIGTPQSYRAFVRTWKTR